MSATSLTNVANVARRSGACAATDNIKQPPGGWQLAKKERTFATSREHATWNADCVEEFGPEWAARPANADGGTNDDWDSVGPRIANIGRARCIRVQHNANRLNCCLKKESLYESCNPDWDATATDCCDKEMEKYCTNRVNFFSDVCKKWLVNLGQLALKDTVAKQVCPEYRFSTNPADKTKSDWCACYNARVPDSLKSDPFLVTQALCLDSRCNDVARALQPSQKQACDINYVVCKNTDVQTKLINAGINKQTIENRCGISIGSNTSGTPPTGQPSAAPTDPPATTTPPPEKYDFSGLQFSEMGLFLGGLICCVLILLILGGIMLARR